LITKEARTHSRRIFSSINGSGKNWRATCKRIKIEHYLTPYTKLNSCGLKTYV